MPMVIGGVSSWPVGYPGFHSLAETVHPAPSTAR